MPFVPVPNVIEIAVTGSYFGQAWANIFHIAKGDGLGGPTVADVTQRGLDAHRTAFNAVLSTGVVWIGATGRDLTTQFGEVAYRPAPAGGTGAVLGEAMPANTAYLIQKLTGFAGRANRGRMYLPGVPESAVNGGTGNIAAATLTALQNAANAWMNSCNGTIDTAPIELSVVSTIQGKEERAQGLRRQVTTVVASSFVATMRDRLKRGS